MPSLMQAIGRMCSAEGLTFMTTGIVSCLRLKACPCHLRGKMPSMSGSIAAVTANVPSSTKYAVRTALTMSFGRNLKSAKSPTKTALPIRGNLRASWKQQTQAVSTPPILQAFRLAIILHRVRMMHLQL